LNGIGYRLAKSYVLTDVNYDSNYYDLIRIHDNTVDALQRLPAAQVFGHATLVRTPTQLTALISIAEAATISMDDSCCQLLWVMVNFIQNSIRADGRGYQQVFWDEEVSFEEYIGRNSQGLETIASQVARLREQQQRFQDELEIIQRQNDEIIRILLGKTQATNQQSSSTPATSSLIKRAEQRDEKFYSSETIGLAAKKRDGQWFLRVDRSTREGQAFAFLLDWLEARLGGFWFKPSSASVSVAPGSLDLGLENKLHAEGQALETQVEKGTGGCWRKKILSGRVLMLYGGAKASSGTELGEGIPSHLPGMVRNDCLLLTAAALWSLFDNSLERVPNCRCAFKAAGGDYIQCRRSEDGWLLWHIFTSETPCNGQDCDFNIPIALTAEETGVRLETTTPCALGWSATSRHSPNSTIWTTIGVTEQFGKNKYGKYTVKEIQALAQLSVPVAVTPQLRGAISFAKRHYEVANSIEHDSIIAIERAAASVVLVYDERRGVHLTLDGADVIEMCCIHFLMEMGCDTTRLPPFTHPTALLRLQTWHSSTFVSARQTYFTGDHLVRQATRKVSELIETTKRANAQDSILLYWLLKDVLRGSDCQAIKAPRSSHKSWHNLASAAPPLILVVGDLDDRFLTLSGAPPRWFASKSQSRHSITQLFDLPDIFNKTPALGGIMSNRNTMKRWIIQAAPYFRAKLTLTSDVINYGKALTDVEHTYKVEKRTDQAASDEFGFGDCTCKEEETQRCLHYIQ
jgi:hypothetical protein